MSKKLDIHKQDVVNRMVNGLENAAYMQGVALKGLTPDNFNSFLDDAFMDGGETRCEKFGDFAMEYALQFGELESIPFTNKQWSCIESALKIIAKNHKNDPDEEPDADIPGDFGTHQYHDIG